MQLSIEVDGLVQRFGRLVPDAAGLLERIAEIRAQASAPHPRLDVALVRFGAGDRSDLRADLAALGLDAAVSKLEAAAVLHASAAELGQLADATTGVMLLAGRHREARAAIGAGIPAYLVSDRQPAEHWHLFLQEVPRVIAESVRLAVPRPLPDSARRGTLIAVREGGAAAGRARGAEVLRSDLRADWVTIGEWQVVYVEQDSASALLLALPDARTIADDVNLASIGVRKNERSEHVMLASAEYALVGSPRDSDLHWTQARRARFGAASSAAGGAEDMAPALDLGEVDTRGGTPFHAFAVAYGNADADRLLVLQPDERIGWEQLKPLALALRERLGSDAILLCPGEARPLDVLWEDERNRLRAIIRLRVGADPEISETLEETLPRLRVLTVSANTPAVDPAALAGSIASRLTSY